MRKPKHLYYVAQRGDAFYIMVTSKKEAKAEKKYLEESCPEKGKAEITVYERKA